MKQKSTINWNQAALYEEEYHFENPGDVVRTAMDMLTQHFHAASYKRGWWHDPITGLSLIPEGVFDPLDEKTEMWEKVRVAWFPYVIATKIALIHSEVSEMLESVRTGKMDDKLPSLPGATAEGADVVIRVLDLLGMMSDHPEFSGYNGATAELFDLGTAIMAKGAYNGVRPDHALAARAAPGGKRY